MYYLSLIIFHQGSLLFLPSGKHNNVKYELRFIYLNFNAISSMVK